jgi:hypothetical protein
VTPPCVICGQPVKPPHRPSRLNKTCGRTSVRRRQQSATACGTGSAWCSERTTDRLYVGRDAVRPLHVPELLSPLLSPRLTMTTTDTRTEAHTHCWHTPNWSVTLTCYPPRREEICCHCGANQFVPIPQPPIPDGHGPHYPRPFGAPITIPFNVTSGTHADPTRNCKCRPENGGSGVCNCVLGGTVTF